MKSKFSLSEGSIPRALLAFSLAVATHLNVIFGGWRKVRMGVADAAAAPVPTA